MKNTTPNGGDPRTEGTLRTASSSNDDTRQANSHGALPRRGVFVRFAARSLKLNRARTIVSIVGIALSCALITAIFTSVATLYEGLLKAEIVTEGAWQVELVNVPESELEAVHADPRVTKSYDRISYGDALMPKSFEGYWGRYLSVQEWPTAEGVKRLKPLPAITEGRAPEAADEIVLTRELKGMTTENGTWLYDGLPTSGRDDDVPRAAWDGGLAVGSTIDLALGERTFVDAETGAEAPCLYDESLYTTEGPSGDVISEYLADPTEVKTYKVVGFYGPNDARLDDVWGRTGPGYLGFVASPDMPVRSTSVYITTNLKTRTDVDGLIEDYTGKDHAIYNGGGNRGDIENITAIGQTVAYSHDSLMRYQGMADERSIWGTLYTLAAILSAVVIVASVSLIYNSFAIAVSERTRQFGLLSSLGASKRQLRRTVYAEALMLAAVGIPLGLAVGLAGTFTVFNIAGEGIGALIDQEAFAGTGFNTISVNPTVLAVSALLALITVLVSAAVPAWRASRVSAVDAIRASRDVRLTRRERRALRHGRRPNGRDTRQGRALTRTFDNLRLRMAGVPALMAHRNLTRASAKGRVAVASLAVSVALIIISGGISHYLGYLTQVVDRGGSDIEVPLNRTLAEGETTADGLAAIDKAYQALSRADTAAGEGYMLLSSLYAGFDAGMFDYDELASQSDQYDMPDRGKIADGTAYAPTTILFVDEASWREILSANRLDRERYDDPEHPVAVALNGMKFNDGKRYSVCDPFKSTGNATLFTHIAEIAGSTFVEVGVDNGKSVARYEGYGDEDDARFDEEGRAIYHKTTRPLDEMRLDTYDLPVGAIVKTFPAPIKAYASIWPTLVLPASALPTLAASSEKIVNDADSSTLGTPFAFHAVEGSYGSTIYARLSFAADNPRAAEASMRETIDDELKGPEWYRTYLSNNAEDVRNAQLMAETVQLFINCFIFITGAIAVANVFNTLTNSIILRRREFAMLKSIGMGNRAFWKMIALECLSYAWKGLVIGLALGAIVTFFIYQAMAMSFAGIGFTVPFVWVLAAIGVALAVLTVSTAYALRKSTRGTIVQTLREDAI